MNDNDIIKNIMDGDHNAFNLLMKKYYLPLRVFASQILNDDVIADDIVQEAFVNLWENRKKMGHVLSAKNYLYTTIRNNSVDIIRSSQKFKTFQQYKVANQTGTDIDYQAVEMIHHLWESLEILPPRIRLVISLSLKGLKQEEIAEEMNIALPTVKSLKARGIKQLRNIFNEPAPKKQSDNIR